MYYDEEWTEQGATLSDKAAMQKYGLSRTEIYAAMRAGKLQFREQSMHGNPWFRLLRREVEALVAEKQATRPSRPRSSTPRSQRSIGNCERSSARPRSSKGDGLN